MSPENLALRDRLLAVLRDAQIPMSTTAVCEQAGGYLMAGPCQRWHHKSDGGIVRVVHCPAPGPTSEHLVAASLLVEQRGYRELRRLEARGMVVSARMPGMRAAFWSAAELPDLEQREQLAELEELWQRSPSA